jgi:hypothetical protein
METMLTKGATDLHEGALAVGVGAGLVAGGKVIERFWSGWERSADE